MTDLKIKFETKKCNVFQLNSMDQKQFNTQLVDILNRAMKETGAETVTWSQYTPYFNDGEPCVFSSQFHYWLEDQDHDRLELSESLNKEVEAFDYDANFLSLFGDNCDVTYNGEEFIVKELEDHD